jgi:hypothetical protein
LLLQGHGVCKYHMRAILVDKRQIQPQL